MADFNPYSEILKYTLGEKFTAPTDKGGEEALGTAGETRSKLQKTREDVKGEVSKGKG